MRDAFPLRWTHALLLLACLGLGLPVAAGEAVTIAGLAGGEPLERGVWLESLDLEHLDQEWGRPGVARSVDGHAIRIGEQVFTHGIGSHANAEVTVELGGRARRFVAAVGVDAEVGQLGTVVFVVLLDDREVARSPRMRGGQAAHVLDVDLHGGSQLTLLVEDGGDHIHYDHADWGGAQIVMTSGSSARPRTIPPPEEVPPDLVRPVPSEPAIHAPRITGATPGAPFLFRIPATGEPPLRYEASGLPAGLVLDPDSGIITGTILKAGRTRVSLAATGPKGRCNAFLQIVAGDHALALTPPMGWNSWNVWGTSVDDAKVRAAADALVETGLAAHGFTYVNIDDAWEGERDAEGNLQPNEKFPDMKSLADYVHAKGLKLGIYTSPGPKTCAGYEGSYGHEHQDARAWATWGIDYVKHDWCSYGRIAKDDSRAELMKPYRLMREALDACGRDIVYSLCQYGMGEVWTWGGEVGGNLWRTTGDIRDRWSSMSHIGFGQAGKEAFAGPGRWNDPDMLVVGRLGWGPTLHPSNLTPNEQVTHITLWSLLAAPLLIGCDLSALDDFTRSLLTNPEVLEVNQDPLGRQAGRVSSSGRTEVWSRPLADGARAIGLFNRSRAPASVTARWDAFGPGRARVRDLWRREDLGEHDRSITVRVPRHGAVLLRVDQAR